MDDDTAPVHTPLVYTALVIVDVQNDFCEGGSLAVEGGAEVARKLTGYLNEHAGRYASVVATRDHHIDPGTHFSAEPDYRDSWPAHCVVGTPGVELHANLTRDPIEAVFDKGEYKAAYSGFEGITSTGVGLEQWLKARDIDTVHVAGLATDYCVRATALDAKRAGFATTVLDDLVAGVAEDTSDRAVAELGAAGVEVRPSYEVLS
jgi:nicotinamidase/pyrazinamidase